MGWSHYWEREAELPQDDFDKAAKDCRILLAAIDVPLAGALGEGKPLFSSEGIVFNGIKGQACEPFSIRPVEEPRRPGRPVFSFCKTEKLPYDLCVQCALVILSHYLRDKIRVMSDAPEEAWVEAKSLCQGCFGYGAEFRLSGEERE